ncbi:MAG: type II secretion system F family protein [Actinocrinis sp.]
MSIMTAQWTRILIAVAHKPAPSVRPTEIVTAILLITTAVLLRRLPSRPRNGGLQEAAVASTRWAATARRPTFRQLLGALLAGCAVFLFIGGGGGLLAGVMATVGALVFGSRRVSESEMRARNRLIAAAPPAVDLFAAALAAGLLPVDAASVVGTAFGADDDRSDASGGSVGSGKPEPPRRSVAVGGVGEIAGRFAATAGSLRAGTDPETAWLLLSVDAATAPVAAAAIRASRTGAPAAETVAKAARDTWNSAEQAAQAQIRSVAVRATAPLALCFLPAFILVGVVPTALGLLTQLQT